MSYLNDSRSVYNNQSFNFQRSKSQFGGINSDKNNIKDQYQRKVRATTTLDNILESIPGQERSKLQNLKKNEVQLNSDRNKSVKREIIQQKIKRDENYGQQIDNSQEISPNKTKYKQNFNAQNYNNNKKKLNQTPTSTKNQLSQSKQNLVSLKKLRSSSHFINNNNNLVSNQKLPSLASNSKIQKPSFSLQNKEVNNLNQKSQILSPHQKFQQQQEKIQYQQQNSQNKSIQYMQPKQQQQQYNIGKSYQALVAELASNKKIYKGSRQNSVNQQQKQTYSSIQNPGYTTYQDYSNNYELPQKQQQNLRPFNQQMKSPQNLKIQKPEIIQEVTRSQNSKSANNYNNNNVNNSKNKNFYYLKQNFSHREKKNPIKIQRSVNYYTEGSDSQSDYNNGKKIRQQQQLQNSQQNRNAQFQEGRYKNQNFRKNRNYTSQAQSSNNNSQFYGVLKRSQLNQSEFQKIKSQNERQNQLADQQIEIDIQNKPKVINQNNVQNNNSFLKQNKQGVIKEKGLGFKEFMEQSGQFQSEKNQQKRKKAAKTRQDNFIVNNNYQNLSRKQQIQLQYQKQQEQQQGFLQQINQETYEGNSQQTTHYNKQPQIQVNSGENNPLSSQRPSIQNIQTCTYTIKHDNNDDEDEY
ncbi:hypothetical protein PPERSA_07497 [Pseudocohnilembus persalinus]|uniref:Uncharacterized protein n=1 Tax=Pseudocohnilembus persalinus TaxID=266149 RepID=A0A0V0QZL8_PSEPJ|nr:hypothetical protein PPERSA_07497 [Pseudocohnilembus persalinus]|eukprot:KRX07747.1 hypothetical protein PPERSA_07497 [Pseudocohnilembus persalinus]